MNSRRNNIDDAHPDTCDWLFGTTEFEQWWYGEDLGTHNGVLWIKGKPGAGKSTLMNHTLSYCEREFNNHLIVAHFFNGRGGDLETTPLGMMRSIVYQLVKKDSASYQSFLGLYREKLEQNRSEWQWQEAELKKFLRSIVKQPKLHSKPLLVLVDALDECVEKEIRGLVDFLESLSVNAVQNGVTLRICLSSRHYPWVSMKKNLELIVERSDEHGIDIATYVREKLIIEDHRIENQIRKKASGVFMWVVLVVAMLNKAYDEGRHEAMQKTLDEIPEDLEDILDMILSKGGTNRTEMINMLQWVLLSERALMPEELYMAVVGKPLPSSEIVRRRITFSSRGLIEIRTESDGESVQFIHLSVKDFLCRNRRFETLDPALEPDAISASHAYIWSQCWSYIQRRNTAPLNEMFATVSDVDCHFLTYVLTYMLNHADAALSNPTIAGRLDHDICHWLAARESWAHQVMTRMKLRDYETYVLERRAYKGTVDDLIFGHEKLMFILIFVPYPNIVSFAVDKGADINITLSDGRTLLQLALYFKSYKATHFLIQKGVELNGADGRDANLLLVTSQETYEIAKLLVANGIDINAGDKEFSNPLQAASHNGNTRLVQLLIEKGADVNIQGGKYGNALQVACVRKGHTTANFLLRKGANVNAQGGYYGNALQAACSIGDEKIVDLLLRNGAHINAQGGHYGNALQAACSIGDEKIVDLLLQNGAHVNARGLFGDALHAAAYKKHHDIVQLLYANGAVHTQNLVSAKDGNWCEKCKDRCVRWRDIVSISPIFGPVRWPTYDTD